MRHAGRVRLAYIDESGSRGWLCMVAVVVTAEQARVIAAGFDAVVAKSEGSHGTSPGAEVHAHDIAQGKRDWVALAGRPRLRVATLAALCRVVAASGAAILTSGGEGVEREVGTARPAASSREAVLRCLLEQLEAWCAANDEDVVVVADEANDQDDERRRWSVYRRSMTSGSGKVPLVRIVDTIHYTPSHASRLLQAADVVAYVFRRTEDSAVRDPRARSAAAGMWATLEPSIADDPSDS